MLRLWVPDGGSGQRSQNQQNYQTQPGHGVTPRIDNDERTTLRLKLNIIIFLCMRMPGLQFLLKTLGL